VADLELLRTATPAISRANWWCSAARSEYATLFLNGPQRSVNRKVQGSNPCPGAKSEYKVRPRQLFVDCRTATVQQPGGRNASARGSRRVKLNSEPTAEIDLERELAVANRKAEHPASRGQPSTDRARVLTYPCV